MLKVRYFLISSILPLLILVACKKIEHHNELPTIITGDTSSVQLSSVIITGVVTPNDAPIQISGHVWSSTNQLPGYSSNEGKTSVSGVLSQNKIISNLTNLLPGTTYYIRGYVVSGTDTVYGNVINFLTAASNLGAVSTGAVTNITLTSADIAAVVTSTGTTPVTQHGIVWSKTNQNPTTADSVLSLGALAAPASYTSSLSNLSPATTYYVRAFFTNSAGTNYGNVVSFTTLSNTVPSVTTDSVISITGTSATAKGNITNIGGSPVTQYGHVWSSVNNVPTINDSKTQLGAASAAINFSSQLTGLFAGTTYYVRSYAINSGGTAYGQVLTFTTASSGNNLPTVTTGNISSVTFSTANADGNITDVGSSLVTQYGHVWSDIHPNPILGDYQSNLGTTNVTKGFNTALTGLQPGNEYNVRAYATNASGTSYGSVVTFRTLVTIATFPVGNITANSANAIGNYNSGNQPVPSVTYGHVWSSTNPVPTINDSKTQFGPAGGGVASYGSSLTGLTNNTKYYVRAYAMNSAGIVYSDIVTFTTGISASYPPSVKTGYVSSISATTAFGQGDITDIGSATVTHYGHVWSSTNNAPTIADSKTDLGSATGAVSFTSPLTALQPTTTYYIRGYAQNSFGITYGVVEVFTTAAFSLASITTGDPYYQPPGVANAIVVFPGTIGNTGNSAVTEHGHVWSKTNTTPTLADNFNQLGAASAGSYNSVFSPTVITPGTYYVRAYVTNSAGTSYGAVKTFTY
jgi:hypothetical protein